MRASDEDKVLLHRSPLQQKLSIPTKLAFGVGGATSVLPSVVLGFYLQIFLLETAELSPALASVVIFTGKLWDAITDPLIGYLSSRTESRWGRMRPWLLFSTIPMAAAYVGIWVVPSKDSAVLTAYYLLMYCAFQTFLSGYHVPYTALTVYLSTDSKERDSATAFRMISEVLGTVAGSLVQAFALSILVGSRADACDISGNPPEEVIQNEKKAYFAGAAVVGILMIIVGYTPFFGVRETTDVAVKRQPFGFFEGLKYTLKQRPFVHLMLVYLCSWLMISITQTNLALYAQYVTPDRADQFQYLIMVLLGTAALFIPVWQLFMIKFGKKMAYVCGISFHFPGLLAVLYVDDSFSGILYGIAVTSGIATAAVYLVPWSMLPDVIDDVAAKDGLRRESLFYAFFVFFQKFSAGFALALSTLALEVFGGYKTGACRQPDSVVMTLRILMSTPSFLLILVSFIFMWRYPIDEARRLRNREELEKKRRSPDIASKSHEEQQSDSEVKRNEHEASPLPGQPSRKHYGTNEESQVLD
eukprot:m.107466 g.107466  ORF g.107466 m.107466 type:complete len:529 (+) comp37300_c0_seq7:140-1726(+)